MWVFNNKCHTARSIWQVGTTLPTLFDIRKNTGRMHRNTGNAYPRHRSMTFLYKVIYIRNEVTGYTGKSLRRGYGKRRNYRPGDTWGHLKARLKSVSAGCGGVAVLVIILNEPIFIPETRIGPCWITTPPPCISSIYLRWLHVWRISQYYVESL